MSKLYTIEKCTAMHGIEYRKQSFYSTGNDLYVPLSKIYTGKDEQIIYIKHGDYIKKGFRKNGTIHIDLLLEADIKIKTINSVKKHKVLGSSTKNDRILVLIKYRYFKIENVNQKKEKDRSRITTAENTRDFNLVEVFPKEELIFWNEDGGKNRLSFDQIISSK